VILGKKGGLDPWYISQPAMNNVATQPARTNFRRVKPFVLTVPTDTVGATIVSADTGFSSRGASFSTSPMNR
jgi:hypothetical protein